MTKQYALESWISGFLQERGISRVKVAKDIHIDSQRFQRICNLKTEIKGRELFTLLKYFEDRGMRFDIKSFNLSENNEAD